MGDEPFVGTGWTEAELAELRDAWVPRRGPAPLLREIRRPILRDRIVLVGEDNPLSRDPRHALAPLPRGRAGDRLRRILELTDKEYLRLFYRTNLLPHGGRWSIKAARAAAGAHLLEFPEDARFVLLGARVAAAFGLDYSPFTVNVRGGLAPDAGHQRFLVLPHPSGRCHAWNYPDSAPRARAALAELRSA